MTDKPTYKQLELMLDIIADKAKALQSENKRLLAREKELEGLINTPEIDDFIKALPLEAAHQKERWGKEHDLIKNPFDWFWLVGYLAQKAATAQVAGDMEKARHHTISTSAVLFNWFKALTKGTDNE